MNNKSDIQHSDAIKGATLALKSSPFPFIPEFVTEWKSSLETNVLFKSSNGRGYLLERLNILGFDHNLLCVSYDLCEQTERIEGYYQANLAMSRLEKIAYMNMRNHVQHRLISLPKLINQPVYESFRLSLWIYSFAVTFGLPFGANIRKSLVKRLVHVLSQTQDTGNWDVFPEALLWILFFGGISATGLPERNWFVKKISVLVTYLGLEHWEETKMVLHSMMWLSNACDSGGELLWVEVRHVKDTKIGEGDQNSAMRDAGPTIF